MRNKLLRIGAACGLGSVSFLLSACSKNGIVIPPVNGAEQKHFEDKWTSQIRGILEKHPDLYYIQDYSKGKPIGEPSGSLPPILLDRTKAEFQSLAGSDFSGHAYQIGVGLSKAEAAVVYLGNSSHLHHIPLPPSSSHLHLTTSIKESAELVEEVNKVLDQP